MVLKSVLKMMLLSKLVAQVDDLHVSAGNLIILDVAEVTSGIEHLGKGLANILADVVHSGRPCMVQLLFKFSGMSAKLTHAGTHKQVFQISGTPVTFVLMAQCSEVGHGNKFP